MPKNSSKVPKNSSKVPKIVNTTPDKLKCILISGPPGVGKTTMIRNICKILQTKGIDSNGFYTEEVREPSGVRVGFDVLTLQSRRVALARKLTHDTYDAGSSVYVGPYTVFVKAFEDVVVPILENCPAKRGQIMVIDEIGKMELKSRKFEEALKRIADRVPLLATVPFYTQTPMPIVDQLRQSPNTKVVSLNRFNRAEAWKQVLDHLQELLA